MSPAEGNRELPERVAVFPFEGKSRRHSVARVTAIVLVVLVGLAARIGLMQTAPARGFFADHLDFVIWSEWAYRNGPTSLYDLPARTLMNARLPREISPEPVVEPFPGFSRYNYPPLAAYVMAFQGWLRHMVDSRVEARPVSAALAEYAGVQPGMLHSPVANTVTTRAVIGLLPTVADFGLAWGVATLVAGLRGRRGGWSEVTAFAVVALAPPVMLNSALWGQTDSMVTCLLAWCLVGVVWGRYGWAGAAYAAAITFKAQAILLAPVLVLAVIALERREGRGAALRALGRFAAAGVAVALLVVLPHALAGAASPDGDWLRWYRRGYEIPIRHQFPLTTLRAFNVWWLDFVLHGQVGAALDPRVVVAGLTKQAWGQVLLAAAVVLSATLVVARWRWRPIAWVALAALVTLAAFLFPTRAHERYVFYCVPLFVAVSFCFARWWPATLALLVVASFEMAWYLWLAPALSNPDAPAASNDAAVGSLVLAVLAVASFVYALAALVPWRRPAAGDVSAPRASGPLFADRTR